MLIHHYLLLFDRDWNPYSGLCFCIEYQSENGLMKVVLLEYPDVCLIVKLGGGELF